MKIPFRRRPFYQHGHTNFLMHMFSGKKPPANNQPDSNAGKPIKQADGSFMMDGKKVVQDANDPTKWIPDNTDGNKKSQDPLANFDGLFHTDPTGGDKNKAPSFQLDPEKLKQLAGSLSFSDHITPELIQKLQSGDPVATKQAMDELGRQVYSTIFQHMPVLTDKYVNSRLEHERQGLGKSVKTELTRNSLDKLASDNPVLKQQLDSISEQLLAKYPDATPDWIAEQTKNYFVSVASALDPNLAKALKGDNKGGTPTTGDHVPGQDQPENVWTDWLSGKPSTPKT